MGGGGGLWRWGRAGASGGREDAVGGCEGGYYIGRVRGGAQWAGAGGGPAGEDKPASPIRLCREESSRQRKLYSY
jgi:hypothetical protein